MTKTLTEVPEQNKVCSHDYSRMVNENGPNGEWTLVCKKCGDVKYTMPPQPIKENKNNSKVLLG